MGRTARETSPLSWLQKLARSPGGGAQGSRGSPTRLSAGRVASLIFAMVLVTATGVIGFVTLQRMDGSRDLVLHTYAVRGMLKDLRSEIEETHATFDLYRLSGDRNDLSGLDVKFEDELALLAQLKVLTRDNPTQQSRLIEIQAILDQDVGQFHAGISEPLARPQGGSGISSVIARISGRRESMSEMIQSLETTEDQLLQDRLRLWHRLFTRMMMALAVCFILALLLLLYNFSLLFREIDQRRAREQIEKRSAESFRLLSARILELRDVERRKIARELHDSVGQFLAGLKLNLGRLQRREPDLASLNHQLLAETIDLTDGAIGEVRTISHLLHPPLLDELGFHSAARWFAEGFAKRSGVQVELDLAEVVDRLPKEIELALFRVLQESLTNVHRHANASKVEIELQRTDAQVTLTVCDDGRGLNYESLLRFRAGQAGGIGLAGMRERLVELGGSLEVESGQSGTQIRATLPTGECDLTDPAAYDISSSPAR